MRNWLRKIFKIQVPYSLPLGEWENWETEVRKRTPIGYFLTETLYDFLNNIKNNWLDKIYYPLKNRFFFKYYLVDTLLDRYRYYDSDSIMLFVNFAILKKYVEIELANMYDYCHPPFKKLYTNSQKGMLYCQYYFDEFKLDEEQKSLFNADYELKLKSFYREVYDLYNWWVYGRPIRISPEDLAGLKDEEQYCSPRFLSKDPDYRKKCEICWQYEKQYAEEDQQMLERLIKIRESLWT